MPYLPFRDGWRLGLGLKPLALQDWIEIDDRAKSDLELKAKLFQEHRSQVFVSLPGSEAGQQEVLTLLIAHLLHSFPQHYQLQAERLVNRLTGETWAIADFASAPLELAGRLVQEDFCLMQPESAGYVLSAGCVCFPLRWDLRAKLGRLVSDIHDPVPGYAPALDRAVNHFFDRLRVDAPGWRMNWSIVDTPALFLPPWIKPEPETAITVENAGDRLWIRVERQTLRRLPQTAQILFTIRTHLDSLKTLALNPVATQGLRDAIVQMPTETRIYKNILPIQSALLDYLTACQTIH